jgi:hypothetical protein
MKITASGESGRQQNNLVISGKTSSHTGPVR